MTVVCITTSMTKTTRIVGPKGQVVIPKEIREQAGFTEGAEVLVEFRDGEVVLRRPSPPARTYVDYFTATYEEKKETRVDIKKVIEEEDLERNGVR